jgi:hypothetical protein
MLTLFLTRKTKKMFEYDQIFLTEIRTSSQSARGYIRHCNGVLAAAVKNMVEYHIAMNGGTIQIVIPWAEKS